MSNGSCKHGFVYGMCPDGCKEDTTDASKEEGVEHPPVHYEFKPVENLNCAICSLPVQEGRVYKGRAICKTCENGLKGVPPKEPEVPYVSEEVAKKFGTQEQEPGPGQG